MKVAFVVLHYCQVDVTFNCIDSLLNLKGAPQIIVVDNASPDGSGKQLDEKFKGSNQVFVILNDANLGFATANNIGYAYAKQELGAEVIAVINNDTIIEDSLFIEKLLTSDLLSRYHIIAPDIINKEGLHQNPFALQPLKYGEMVRNYKRLGILQLLYSIPLIGDLKARVSFSNNEKRTDAGNILEMIVPHGAAIIYTPLWVNKEDIAFYPGTFLYLEEELLFYYVLHHNYKTIYVPDLKIHHLEDVSTNAQIKGHRKKALFQIKQLKVSYKVLKEYITTYKLQTLCNEI